MRNTDEDDDVNPGEEDIAEDEVEEEDEAFEGAAEDEDKWLCRMFVGVDSPRFRDAASAVCLWSSWTLKLSGMKTFGRHQKFAYLSRG